jgi:hypothetical protein
MRLFSGLPKTDYQDVLRVLGRFIDERGYRNVRIIENEEGLLVQVTRPGDGKVSTSYETFLLTDDAIQQLLTRAYGRRESGQPRPTGELRSTGLTGLLPSRPLTVPPAR